MSTLASLSDQCVVLDGVSWTTYQGLLADRDQRRRPRLAYDQGALEIMSPGAQHESLAQLITILVATLIEEWELDVAGLGSHTFNDQEWGKGFEPDACFYIRDAAQIRGKDRLDARSDPPPEIVFEVDITSSSINKLPIYARFGVPEIWRHDGQRATILVRHDDAYQQQPSSVVLPGLTAVGLTHLLELGRQAPLRDWLVEVRGWARGAR